MKEKSLSGRIKCKCPLPDHLVRAPGPAPLISRQTLDFHQRTPVVDLHSDPMLKNRDLNTRNRRGHVDFPRLVQGGVNLAIFAVPTGGPPIEAAFKFYCRLNRWPARALENYRTMADFQINMACSALDASGNKVRLVKTAREFTENHHAGGLGIVLAIEGGQALMGKLENLDRFHQKGVRSLSLTHFVKNDLGGSSYHQDERNRGVSPFGKDVLCRMQELGMIVDLAHASRTTFEDALKCTRGPLIVSHTGVSGIHPLWRNLEDDQIRAVAGRNGVVGIIYEGYFLGSRALDRVIDHMEHIIAVAGEDFVALGSDWDGCLLTPHGLRSAADLPCLTQRMFERGWPEETAAKVLGGNFIRVFGEINAQ